MFFILGRKTQSSRKWAFLNQSHLYLSSIWCLHCQFKVWRQHWPILTSWRLEAEDEVENQWCQPSKWWNMTEDFSQKALVWRLWDWMRERRTENIRQLGRRQKERALTCTDMYWHVLTRTDTYWHLLTRTDTYWHVLTPTEDFRLKNDIFNF